MCGTHDAEIPLSHTQTVLAVQGSLFMDAVFRSHRRHGGVLRKASPFMLYS